MNRSARNIIIGLMAVLLLAGCGSSASDKPRIVASKGLPSELLLVVDKAVWQSDVADTLMAITQSDVPGLMQHEDYFRVTRIFSPYYVQKYTTMHSQLFVTLDGNLKKPLLGVSYDVVARPQIQVTVSAPNLDELRRFLSTRAPQIRQLIGEAQLDMRAAQLRKRYSQQAAQDLKAVMGYTICAPENIRATKKGKRFLWAGSNLNEKDLNVVVYTYPWDGSEVRTPESFVSRRDSVMKANIPGSEPDQWMQTTRIDGRPILTSVLRPMNGQLTQEVHGLWEMRNGALGGPFVSLVRIDSLASEVIVAEGFVYSPSTDKRELLRTVEASLRTLRKG